MVYERLVIRRHTRISQQSTVFISTCDPTPPIHLACRAVCADALPLLAPIARQHSNSRIISSAATHMKLLGLNGLTRLIDHFFKLCKHAYVQDEFTVTVTDVHKEMKYSWSSNTYPRIPITEKLHMASTITRLCNLTARYLCGQDWSRDYSGVHIAMTNRDVSDGDIQDLIFGSSR
jgi:hypothetical protein